MRGERDDAGVISRGAQVQGVLAVRTCGHDCCGARSAPSSPDSDDLFLEHTLLVNSAEIIAHLVLGLDVTDMQPATLLIGQHFAQAQIYGVVEEDFFDWVLEVPGGASFIRTLARRVARFDWTNEVFSAGLNRSYGA